jgi:biopolymer transport protein ExbD
VYKQVPYTVVADWCQQGRLGPTDQLRPAGTSEAWKRVEEVELFADYLPRSVPAATVPVEPAAAEPAADPGAVAPVEIPETPDLDPLPRSRSRVDGDDEVDMIPLIDISMVLLVFFIMIRAAGSLSSVDVPDMRYAAKRSNDPNTVTITIEKADETTVVYSVRVGERPLQPDNANLPGPRVAIERLNAVLADMDKPPEVRIACGQNLPSARVFELIPDLKVLEKKHKIKGFTAEVNEAPPK